MHRFALVLTARYPSEKAYAVTTRETARAANRAGYPTLVFAPTEAEESDIKSLSSPLIVTLSKFLGKKPLIIDKAIFTIRRYLIAVEFRKANAKNQEILTIWTRDPIVATLVPRHQELILELHQAPSKLDSILCKFLNLRRNILVCTLTSSHQNNIQPLFTKHRVVVMPMAVNQEFFDVKRQELFKNKVVFLGKGWSSGHDNNLVQILQELAIYNNECQEDLGITFLGIEESYQNILKIEAQRVGIDRGKVEFISHLPHSQVPKNLIDFSIGLIPYRETEYNNQRFPIKALEYAAAGISIVASDIKANREILTTELCYFYSPEILGDLSRVLKAMIDDSDSRLEKLENARVWASRHTYLHRVNVVIDALNDLRKKEI